MRSVINSVPGRHLLRIFPSARGSISYSLKRDSTGYASFTSLYLPTRSIYSIIHVILLSAP